MIINVFDRSLMIFTKFLDYRYKKPDIVENIKPQGQRL